jgi:hypothetical protein
MRGLKTPQISQIYTEKSVVISVISGNILWFKIFVASSGASYTSLELVCVLGFEGKSVNFLMRQGGKMRG